MTDIEYHFKWTFCPAIIGAKLMVLYPDGEHGEVLLTDTQAEILENMMSNQTLWNTFLSSLTQSTGAKIEE